MSKKEKTVTLNEWIEALESGDYAQGMGRLCQFNDEGEACYCAVGVLAELKYGEDAWVPTYFRPSVLEVNGNAHSIPFCDFPSQRYTWSTSWNDSGLTFAEIAEKLRNE